MLHRNTDRNIEKYTVFMMTYSGSWCIISVFHGNITLQVHDSRSLLEDQNVKTEPGDGTIV